MERLTIAQTQPKLDRHGFGYQAIRRSKHPKPPDSPEEQPTASVEWVSGGTLEEEKAEVRRQAGLAQIPAGASAAGGGSVPVVVEGRAIGGRSCDLNNTLSRLYMRRTLEDPKYISLALMFVSRHSEAGKNICWPAPEAEMRLRLRVGGLPTNPEELLGLIRETFEEREEQFDLGEVTRDYNRQFGRVQYDWTKTGIDAYRVSRF